MLDQLRAKIRQYLAEQTCGILSAAGPAGPLAMPVRCRSEGLSVECLLPRWADLAYSVEQDPRVLLLFPDAAVPARRWLQVRGAAEILDAAGLPIARITNQAFPLAPHLYLVIRVVPLRIDLFDESQGWGARETLDI